MCSRTRANAPWPSAYGPPSPPAGRPWGRWSGGVLLEYFWWGSVFLINVPVVLALLWPTWRLVPAGRPAAHRPWDLGAAVLIMTALLGLVFGLKELGKPTPDYGVAMLAVAVGAVAMTLFARRQRGQAEPMIDVGMFRDAGFSRGVAVALIAMLTLVGVELVLSQRLQLVQGMTPLQAALLLLPVPLAAAAAGPLAGLWLGRAGERRVMGTALALAGLGAAGMVVGTEWPLAGQMAVLALLGAGLGGAMTAASTAVMLHAPADRASMAASIEEVAYELGSVLGVTLFGSIMTTVYTRTLVLPADAPAAAQLRDSLDQALAAAETMAPQWAQQVLPMAYQAFDHAYAVVAADRRGAAGRSGAADAGPPARASVLAELHVVERGVQAVGGQQLAVRPVLDDLAGVQHDDTVGVLHGGQPVGDDQRGAPAHQPLQRCLHLALDSLSSAEVASSRIRTGAFLIRARAIARRWRWPPDRRAAFWPTGVWMPSGKPSTNSSRLAAASASRTRASSTVPPAP